MLSTFNWTANSALWALADSLLCSYNKPHTQPSTLPWNCWHRGVFSSRLWHSLMPTWVALRPPPTLLDGHSTSVNRSGSICSECFSFMCYIVYSNNNYYYNCYSYYYVYYFTNIIPWITLFILLFLFLLDVFKIICIIYFIINITFSNHIYNLYNIINVTKMCNIYYNTTIFKYWIWTWIVCMYKF